MDFMKQMQSFADKAVKLHQDLTNRSDELPEGYFEPPSGRLTCGFRFILKNTTKNDIFDKISISTPMDSGCIETALYKNDDFVENKSLGYGDTLKQFGTINELIKELNYLDGTISDLFFDFSTKCSVNIAESLEENEEEENDEEENDEEENDEEENDEEENDEEEEEEEEEEVQSSKEEFAVQSFKEKFELLFSFKQEQEAKNLEIQSLKEELELVKKSFSIICASTKELKELLEK
jgi:hypothetical protein